MFSCWSVCITHEEHENWCVSLSLTSVNTDRGCELSSLVLPVFQLQQPMRSPHPLWRWKILRSLWWRLYRMLIYNFAAELLRPEEGKTIWRHNIHVNIFVRPTVCVYFKMPAHAHTHLTIKWQNKQCIEERRARNKMPPTEEPRSDAGLLSPHLKQLLHLVISSSHAARSWSCLEQFPVQCGWVGGALLCTHNSRLTAGR